MKNPLDRAARYFGIGVDDAPRTARRTGGRETGGPGSRAPRGERPDRKQKVSAGAGPAADRNVEHGAAEDRAVPNDATESETVETETVANGAGDRRPAEDRPVPVETHDPAAEHPRSVSSRLGMAADPETEGEPDRLGEEDWEDPDHQPVAARSFSGRTLLLLLIVVALVVPLAKPVHTYFSQQAEVTALRQDISRLQSEQKDLQDQKSRWDSDDYVREQARERLYYVQPGDVPYVVTGQDGSSTKPADSSAEVATAAQATWGQNLWQSVAGAGR